LPTIDEVLAQRSQPEESLGFSDYLMDVPRGIASGAAKFGQSIGALADKGVELFGGDLINDEYLSDEALPDWMKTRTLVGGFASGITQFSLGFAGLGLGRVGAAAGNALRGTTLLSRLAGTEGAIGSATRFLTSPYVGRQVIGGVLTDAIAFQGNDGRLSDMLVEMGGVGDNTLTRWLATDDDDSWVEARFKNAFEGVFSGLALDSAFHSVTVAKKLAKISQLKKAGEISEVEAKLLRGAGSAKQVEQELTGLRTLFQKPLQAGEVADDFIERYSAYRDMSLKDIDITSRDEFVDKAVTALSGSSIKADPRQIVDASLALTIDPLAKLYASAKGVSIDEAYAKMLPGLDNATIRNDTGVGSEVARALQARYAVAPADGGEQFFSAIKRANAEHPFGAAVEVKDQSFYTDPNTKLFLSEDKLAGVAVTPQGDLVSVFKVPGSKANVNELLEAAAPFSKTLDGFDINGKLPDLYGPHGFRPVARVEFNPEFAPPGWKPEMGTPDVVLMVRDEGGASGLPAVPAKDAGGYTSIKDKVPVVDYETAVKMQQEAASKVAATTDRVNTLFQLATINDMQTPEGKAYFDSFRQERFKNGNVKPVLLEDAALNLDAFAKARDFIEVGDFSDSAMNKMSDFLVTDMEYALQNPKAKVALNWYDVSPRKTMVMVSSMPGMEALRTEPKHRLVFMAALGAHSNGTAPKPNLIQAMDSYRQWLADPSKPIPVSASAGSPESVAGSLASFHKALDSFGGDWDKLEKFMLSPVKVSDMRKMGFIVDELDGEVVPGAALMGEKVGTFMANSMGYADGLTMDLWFMRTMRRGSGQNTLDYATEIAPTLKAWFDHSDGKKPVSFIDQMKALKPSQRMGFKMEWYKNEDWDSVKAWAKTHTKELEAKARKEGWASLSVPQRLINRWNDKLSPLRPEAPASGSERSFLRKSVNAALERVNKKLVAAGQEPLTQSRAQALLWYNEKDIWANVIGTRETKRDDFFDAIKSIYDDQGIKYDEAAIEQQYRTFPLGLHSAEPNGSGGAVSANAESGAAGMADGSVPGSAGESADVLYQRRPALPRGAYRGEVPGQGSFDFVGPDAPVKPSADPAVPTPAVRGWIQFLQDDKAVVGLTKAADESTLLHELSHRFQRSLGIISEKLDESLKETLGLKDSWDSEAGRNAAETFARAFEQYASKGVSPTDGLAGAFSMFKTWLTDVYQNIAGSPLKEEFDPKLLEFIDTLVGGQKLRARGAPTVTRGIEQTLDTVANDAEEAMKRGSDPVQAIAEGVQFHVNFDQLIAGDGLKSYILGIAERMAAARNRAVGGDSKGVKSRETTFRNAAETYGDQPMQAIKDLKSLEGTTANLDEILVAGRAVVVGLAKKGYASAAALEKFAPGEVPDDLAATFRALKGALEEAHLTVQTIQTNAARAVSSGNIAVGAANFGTSSIDRIFEGLGAKDSKAAAAVQAAEATAAVLEKQGKPEAAKAVRERAKARVPGISGEPRPEGATKPSEASSAVPTTDPAKAPVDPTAAPAPAEARPEKGPGVPRKVRDKISDDLDVLKDAQIFRDAQKTDRDPLKLLADSEAAKKLNAGHAFLEYYKASIMSGLPTLAVNGISGGINTSIQLMSRFLGAASKLDTKEMQFSVNLAVQTFSAFADMVKYTTLDAGGVSNGPKGFGAVWNAVKNETPVLASSTGVEHMRAIRAQTFGLSDTSGLGRAVNFLGGAVRIPFRVNQGMEEMWRQANYLAYIRTQGLEEAKSALQGVKPADLPAATTAFVESYIKDAFDFSGAAAVAQKGKKLEFLHKEAMKYAESTTYTQDLVYGLGKTLSEAKGKHPYLDLVIPFVKAPTNIFRQMVRLTPGINLLQERYQARLMSRTGDEALRARGEMLLGVGIWGTAIYLAASGQVTGTGPLNPEERKALEATGWRPFSLVREGADGKKEYYDFRRIDPLAGILGLAADFSEASAYLSEDQKDTFGRAALLSLANNVTSKTYLQGINEAMKAIVQPDRNAGTFIQGRLSSLVPNFVARIAGAEDESVREVRSILDAFRKRIPGLADDLPPRRDMFGEAVTPTSGYVPFAGSDAEGSIANFVGRAASPVQYSRDVGDDVKDEIAKLRAGFGPPSTKMNGLDLTGYTSPSGQSAHDRYQQMIGDGTVTVGGKRLKDEIQQLIRSNAYQSSPAPSTSSDRNNARVQMIQGAVEKYRSVARKRLLQEFPDLNRDLRTIALQQQ
jgi:hypothetical protein